MRKTLLSVIAVLVGAAMIFAYADVDARRRKRRPRPPATQYTAVLNTGEQTPAMIGDPLPDGDGLGVAHIRLNLTTKILCTNMNVTGLSSDIVVAHIHDGAPGVNGPAIIPFMPELDGGWRDACSSVPLTAEQISKLVRGLLYINVHTVNFPNGEVRGQIYAQR